jgi:hypothetical protein
MMQLQIPDSSKSLQKPNKSKSNDTSARSTTQRSRSLAPSKFDTRPQTVKTRSYTRMPVMKAQFMDDGHLSILG